MGLPSFYRWLVDKYPKIVLDAAAATATSMEFDNLYLDMNRIICPCFNPEDNFFPPTTYEDVFNSIYEFMDNLFNIVRPRKLLYLAMDGVAPRAKMNHQRGRRFRNAKDSDLADETEDMLRKKFEAEGKTVLPKQESELCDPNVITPGTEFTHLLSTKLQNYVTLRLETDPNWEHIKVILSDSSVPGEGEHKIMSFIRAQRCGDGYDPNTRHCLYGLDADLIMLALATHEVHFFILREDVFADGRRGSVSDVEHQVEAYLQKRAPVKKKLFQFLDVCLLREYLQIDMYIDNPPEGVRVDLERLIDDFVFICFFSGNDFLPHMPTLDIYERAIDLLIHVYRKEFKRMGGYLVDTQRIEDKNGAYINLKRVERFLVSIRRYEEEIFKKRSEIRDRKMKRILEDFHAEANEESNLGAALDGPVEANNKGKDSDVVHLLSRSTQKLQLDDFVEMTADSSEYTAQVLRNTLELKQKLKECLRNQSDTFRNGVFDSDKVKLGAPGWRERYYEINFSTNGREELESMRKVVMQKYVEGLVWVLKYYYSGVPSWNWYYPFHYAPFASDMKDLSQLRVSFQKGFPLKPFDQLMAVLPPKSAHALPIAYKKLMVDENSKILDFYPTEFAVDADGKRFLWKAVPKLPFIDEERLLAETRVLDKELTDHERLINAEGKDRLFIRRSSILDDQISSKNKGNAALLKQRDIGTSSFLRDLGLNGCIHFEADQSTDLDSGCTDKDANVLSLFFELPPGCSFKPHLLEGVDLPVKTIAPEDIITEELWHSCSRGMNRQGRYNQYSNHKWVSKHGTQPPPAGNGWDGGNGRGRGRGRSIEHQNFVPSQRPVSSFPIAKTWTSSRGPRPSELGHGHWQNGSRANDSRGSWRNESFPRANDVQGMIHPPSGLVYRPKENAPGANNTHERWPKESFPRASIVRGNIHSPAGLGYNSRQNSPRANDSHGKWPNESYPRGSGHECNPWRNGLTTNDTHSPRANDPRGRWHEESSRANDSGRW